MDEWKALPRGGDMQASPTRDENDAGIAIHDKVCRSWARVGFR